MLYLCIFIGQNVNQKKILKKLALNYNIDQTVVCMAFRFWGNSKTLVSWFMFRLKIVCSKEIYFYLIFATFLYTFLPKFRFPCYKKQINVLIFIIKSFFKSSYVKYLDIKTNKKFEILLMRIYFSNTLINPQS